MKKYFFVFLLPLVALFLSCQKKDTVSVSNFGFEKIENGKPVDWYFPQGEDYIIYLDSVNPHSGKYSAVIEFKEKGSSGFSAVSVVLPDNYEGEQITLSGYVRTENVKDGYAGLWMRIDPQIAFDNMGQRGITGTTDWTMYEITLPLKPLKTKKIVIGALLTGKGKMWVDDFRVTIDGEDIANAKIVEKEIFPAENDKEFDAGSDIVISSLDEMQITNLELLGRLWGFLKYHHPAIGKGKYNWDYELFRMLPDYLNVKDIEARDRMLIGWIGKYGEIPTCTTCQETLADAFLKPDFSWVETGQIHTDLKNEIMKIYANRHQGVHFYIGMMENVGNPEFKNENFYAKMPYPDAGFRLLSLYRYWNMIQYFFPYKHLTDKDWNKVLKDYIPVFISASNKLEYELAVIQLIGDVCDTHANLYNGGSEIEKQRGNYYAPLRVRFVEDKFVVTEYYTRKDTTLPENEIGKATGLKIGDIITHINSKSVEEIIDSLRIYYPASNEATRLRNISGDLLRSKNDSMNIQYSSSGRSNQVKELVLYRREDLHRPNWSKEKKDEKCYKLLDENIGYVTLASIKDEDVSVIKETFKECRGIIIDIRNYPSTFVPFSLGSYFVSQPTPFVKFTCGNANNPGEFTFTPNLEIKNSGEFYQGKLVVLVNEETQSQAEYTSMAFRAGRNTTIVGSTTAGADGNISTISLPGGLSTVISGIGVYYPNGDETQRIGIVPDIKITPTINGIKQGKDEVLGKAIEVIMSQSY